MKGLTARQQGILSFISRHRETEGFAPSVREIGEHFGLAPATVHDHIRALERKGCLERRPQRSRSLSPVARIEPVSATQPDQTGLPLVGRVAAGAPILADENVEEVVPLPEAWAARGSFLLRVEGESMRDAHILDGDLVLVRPSQTAANEEIVVALIDDEATVKRFRKTEGGIELHPENPEFEPISIHAQDPRRVQIVGTVVSVFRTSVGRRRR